MSGPRKYPPELLDRGARLVFESGRPIAHVARDLGLPSETLRKHVRQLEADEGLRADLPTSEEREEIKALRREVYELRRANEILEDAARIDAAEDELYGDARGDELPEGLRTSGDRRKVLREAKQALEAERAAQAKKVPRDRSERLVECRRRLRQTGSSSATSSPSTPPGMRRGSPAMGRGG